MSQPFPLYPLPSRIIHADWSLNPRKRWMACAILGPGGRYRLDAPQPVGPLDQFLSSVKAEAAAGACLLVGFDFPIGLPRAFALQAGITDFLSTLPGFGQGGWGEFYSVAETADQICQQRPFYPARPGGTRRLHLLERLGLPDFNDLRRQCELPRPGRGAACPLFWTMGAQQVGKAAICGWQQVLSPGLLDPALDLAIWPFSGELAELLHPGRVVVAETYPAEYYAAVLNSSGSPARSPRFSKRNLQHLRQFAPQLFQRAEALSIELDAGLCETIEHGFGPPSGGEDAFDATIGLFGMLSVILGHLAPGELHDEEIRHIEGWILGQPIPS